MSDAANRAAYLKAWRENNPDKVTAGKGVCGLHVPWNLQVLTATENKKKFTAFVAD